MTFETDLSGACLACGGSPTCWVCDDTLEGPSEAASAEVAESPTDRPKGRQNAIQRDLEAPEPKETP